MKLNRPQLRQLRLLRLHLQELIADSSGVKSREVTVTNRVARQHLRWIHCTLLLEQPSHTLLLRNMGRFERDFGPLLRVTNDMLGEV